MARRIDLKPYNMANLDSMVTKLGTKLDIYFNFEISKFTAKTYQDKSNKTHVFYSEHRGRNFTDEDRTKFKDYAKNMEDLIAIGIKGNNICDTLLNPDLYNTIYDVVYIPELKGVTFLTYSYVIGKACAEVYLAKSDNCTMEYTLGNTMQILNNVQVKQIAMKFIANEIKVCGRLGYSLYNRQMAAKDSSNNTVRLATDNMKRFGTGPVVKEDRKSTRLNSSHSS